MTFDEFIATKLPVEFFNRDGSMTHGWEYCDSYAIEEVNALEGRYLVIAEQLEWHGNDLATLERELFDHEVHRSPFNR